MRPDVVVVGDGRVSVTPEVVWVMSKVVATFTVVAAVPMSPLLAWSAMATAVSKVELAFVNVLPVVTVRPPLNVPNPITTKASSVLSSLALER